MDMKEVEELGTKARGKGELIKHLLGDRLTMRQRILAKCYDCMGFYSDGRGQDCEMEDCPLYPAMPYGKKPERKRKISDEQKRALMVGLTKARKIKSNAPYVDK